MELVSKNNLKQWLEEYAKRNVGPDYAAAMRLLKQLDGEKVWINLSNREFGNMVCSTVRYALGRETYIVKDTCDFVSELLPYLHMMTLAVLERDIANAKSYGDENVDKPHWMMLLDSITFEIEKRKEDVNA